MRFGPASSAGLIEKAARARPCGLPRSGDRCSADDKPTVREHSGIWRCTRGFAESVQRILRITKWAGYSIDCETGGSWWRRGRHRSPVMLTKAGGREDMWFVLRCGQIEQRRGYGAGHGIEARRKRPLDFRSSGELSGVAKYGQRWSFGTGDYAAVHADAVGRIGGFVRLIADYRGTVARRNATLWQRSEEKRIAGDWTGV